ncbi:CCR4-NOT transcription complex subunit 3 [Hordeum vulgare]|nr:CCR4-NOT transcription complex subunit 3 [Hordeum vulgare]
MQLRSIHPSQGCPGAYSEAAAKKAYPSCETVPCEYFETAFQRKGFRCQRQQIKLPEQLSIPNLGPSVRAVPTAISTTAAAVSVLADTISSPGPVRPIIPAAAPTIFAASAAVRNAPESMPAVASTPANLSTAVKDDESMSFPPRRPCPAVTEIGLGRGITRGLTSQALAAPISVGPVPGNGSITAIPAINDLSKRNILNTDERVNSGGLSQQLVSPLGSKIQQQPVLKTNDAVSSDSSNTSESAVLGGRVFSSPVVPGAQWRAQTLAGFQNQSETCTYLCSSFISEFHYAFANVVIDHKNFMGISDGQFRGRPEILNDSFLELPSNMVSVVSWFFKYAWWFFIEGNQLTVFVVVADLVLASLVSGSMDSLQKKLCIHHGWQDNVTLASISFPPGLSACLQYCAFQVDLLKK